MSQISNLTVALSRATDCVRNAAKSALSKKYYKRLTPDCWFLKLKKLIADKAYHQTRLADSRVAQEDELEVTDARGCHTSMQKVWAT